MSAIPKVNEQQVKDRWQLRWKALGPVIQLEVDRLERLESLASARNGGALQAREIGSFVRLNTLKALLNGFSAFVDEQFHFFSRGFFDLDAHRFSPTSELKNRHYKRFKLLPEQVTHAAVLGTILSKAAYDLDVLARINDQRFASGKIADRLVETDLLTIGALRAMGDSLGLFTNTPGTILTYFADRMKIRVVPYVPVALIAIPITGIEEDRELLAIPHEVGHFLYWKSRINVTSEQSELSSNKKPVNPVYLRNALRTAVGSTESPPVNWIYEWEEEIFADVVGCLIGGPAMVPGLHEHMNTLGKDDFLRNDGEHPIPAIRPYILTHVLQTYLHESTFAHNAKVEWENILQGRGLATLDQLAKVAVYKQSELRTDPCSLAELKEIVLKMVDTMIGSVLLQDNSQLAPRSAQLRWSIGTDTFDKQRLIQAIRKEVNQEQQLWKPNFADYRDDGSLRESAESFWKTKLAEIVIARLPQNPVWWNGQEKKIENSSPIPPDDWCSILEFGGWTTEGPGPGNAH